MKIAGKILISITAAYLIVAPAYFTRLIDEIPCRNIIIDISDSPEINLITKNEILNIISNTIPSLPGSRINDVRLCDIEARIKERREIKTAEVYFSINGSLCVFIRQRNPVMRIVTGEGDYFIDDEGVLIRKRRLYTPRVHIVGGNVVLNRPVLNGVSILDTAAKNHVLRDIFILVNYIRHDRFWSAQIDQLWVDEKGEIDMIPRTGNHIIHLGTIDNYTEKLENLEAFYHKILPIAGWDTYKRINLEFKDQIVCNKK